MGSSSPERREDPATNATPAEAAQATPQSELRKAIVLVQHQLNNPLAALLAEAQLLGLEPTLGAEHRAAAARITELTRRVIAMVRDLDSIAGDPKPQRVDDPTT
jgi:signal transduction histidine kinase